MKEKRIIPLALLTACLFATAGLAMGITYASFAADPKTYSFNPSHTGVTIHDVVHYFDSSSGDGRSSDHPYRISSPAHLRNLAKLTNLGVFGTTKYYFELKNSFNWSGAAMEPIGKDSTTPFYGVFEGNCFTIQGLEIDATGAYAGMFGYVSTAAGGAIEDLILSGPTLNCVPTSATNVQAGFIAGYVASTTSNCVRRVMIYGGNENSEDSGHNPLINRAVMTANSSATVTSSAPDTKSVIIGGRADSKALGPMSFAAHMGDITYTSNELGIGTSSTQTAFSSQTNFTYSFYRSTSSNTVVKVSS